MKKNKYRKFLIVALLAVVAVSVFFLVRKRGNANTVTVYKLTPTEIQKTISASGETEVIEDFRVLSPISGYVKTLYFKSGDTVKEGDLVLQLDTSSFKATADTAYTTYVSAQKDLEALDQKLAAAKSDVDYYLRVRDEIWREYMADNGESKKQSYKLAQSNYLGAESNLKTLQEQKPFLEQSIKSGLSSYQSAQQNLQKTNFYAPASGSIALNSIQKNSLVTGGGEIFSIANAKNLIFKAHIDEADISMVKEGMSVKLNLDAYPANTYDGKIGKIDTKVIIQSNGSAVVDAEIIFENDHLKPIVGLNGSADIELESLKDALGVPLEAIYEEAGNSYVYKVENGKAVKTKISTTLDGDSLTGIKEGLSENDTVITGPDLSKIKDGSKVRINAAN